MSYVIIWQRIEGALVFASTLALFALGGSGLPWWVALLVFFAPDLSFAAYALGPVIGARAYNLVHLYACGPVLMALGSVLAAHWLVGLGAIWLAHCGLDRMLGYGLKAETSFQDTHLGRIGRQRRSTPASTGME